MVSYSAQLSSSTAQAWAALIRIEGLGLGGISASGFSALGSDGRFIFCTQIPSYAEASGDGDGTVWRPYLIDFPELLSSRAPKGISGGFPELGELSFGLLDFGDLLTTIAATESNPVTALSDVVNASQTTIALSSTASISAGQVIYVGSEAMEVLTVPGATSATVRRGYLSTEPLSHQQGSRVFLVTPFVQQRQVELSIVPINADSRADEQLLGSYVVDVGPEWRVSDDGSGAWHFAAKSQAKYLQRLAPIKTRTMEVLSPLLDGAAARVSADAAEPVNQWGWWPGSSSHRYYLRHQDGEVLTVGAAGWTDSLGWGRRDILNTGRAELAQGDRLSQVFVAEHEHPGCSFRYSPGPSPAVSVRSGTWVNTAHWLELILIIALSPADDGAYQADLTSGLASGDTNIPVTSTTGLSPGDHVWLGVPQNFYREAVLVSAVVDALNFTATRGQLGTSARAHTSAARVTKNPHANFATGQNNYSSLCPGWGLGLSATAIDWQNVNAIIARTSDWVFPNFVYGDPKSQKSFAQLITEEFLRPVGAFLMVEAGQMKIVLPSIPLPGSESLTLGPANILQQPVGPGVAAPDAEITLAGYDETGAVTYEVGPSKHPLTFSAESFSEIHEQRNLYRQGSAPELVPVPGGDENLQELYGRMAETRLYRTQRTAHEVNLAYDISELGSTVGDVCAISLDGIPNLSTAARNWSELYGLLLEREPVIGEDEGAHIRGQLLIYPRSVQVARVAPSAYIETVGGSNDCTVSANKYTSTDNANSLPITDAAAFFLGDVVRIYSADLTLASTATENVSNIAGNVITLTGDFGGALAAGLILSGANYDDASSTQKTEDVHLSDLGTCTPGTTGTQPYVYGGV